MSILKEKKILIVEDEYSNYYLLKKIIESVGGDSIWVTNGRDAVDKMNDHEDIDMVLMDLKIPIMNGLEATRDIKKNHPEKPIIAVTAYAMKSDRATALEAGCDEYVAKPLKKAQLLSKIEKLI